MYAFRLQHRKLLRSIQHTKTWARSAGYDASGTDFAFVNDANANGLYITKYSKYGFTLNNGFKVLGSTVFFPRTFLHWNVPTAEHITENSLSMFPLLVPKLDLLVIGIGLPGAKYDKNIYRFLKSKNIPLEILPTEQACATFNYLSSEGRFVAGALIPALEEGSRFSLPDMTEEKRKYPVGTDRIDWNALIRNDETSEKDGTLKPVKAINVAAAFRALSGRKKPDE